MQIPFLAWLLQGIPESIASVALIMVISTGKLPWKTVLKVGLIQAVTAYLVRLLPFTPGVHSIVLLSTMSLYLSWLAQVKFPIAVISSFITASILTIFELVFYVSLSRAGVGSFDKLLNSDVWLRILVGYPQILFLFVLTWFCYRRKYDFSKLFNRASKDW